MISSVEGSGLDKISINSIRTKHLVVFVVDCSGGGAYGGHVQRIEAVKGAAMDIMPRVNAAVVSCQNYGAVVVMEPTCSALVAQRKLCMIKKSVMGNLGEGISLAIPIVKDALASESVSEVTLIIVADGKAHGLLANTMNCDNHILKDLCDIELEADAMILHDMERSKFRCVVLDTEEGTEWNPEGASFAEKAKAEYLHSPRLTRNKIKKIVLKESQGLRKNSPENRY